MLLKNPVLPFQPLLLLFTLSIHHTPQRFLSVPSTFPPFLFLPTNDPTDEPSPFRGRFQLFALHISPTFASNLKSCSRQIQNLFQKNRAPWIFQLCAGAHVQSSIESLMNLIQKSKIKTDFFCKIYLIVGAAWICGAAGLERVPCEFADENQC